MASIRAQSHHAQLGPLTANPLQEHWGGVPTAVVDRHDFVCREHPVGDQRIRHRSQAVDEEREDRLLVEHGDDDAEADATGLGGCGHGEQPTGERGRGPSTYEIEGPPVVSS